MAKDGEACDEQCCCFCCGFVVLLLICANIYSMVELSKASKSAIEATCSVTYSGTSVSSCTCYDIEEYNEIVVENGIAVNKRKEKVIDHRHNCFTPMYNIHYKTVEGVEGDILQYGQKIEPSELSKSCPPTAAAVIIAEQQAKIKGTEPYHSMIGAPPRECWIYQNLFGKESFLFSHPSEEYNKVKTALVILVPLLVLFCCCSYHLDEKKKKLH